jgi:uncharacterized protein (TIGR02001 family)
MKKMTHSLVLGSALAATSLMSGMATAEISGNIGVTSNYLWRGTTQTNDTSAVSGGIDYTHNSGFYLGTWTSNLGGSDYEADLYAGYGLKAGPVDLDMGAISYEYPVSETYFREVYLNASFNMFTLGAAYTVGSDDDNTATFSNGDLYISAKVALEVSKGLELGITAGSYNFKDDLGEDYTHFQVSLSKDDFTFAIDKNDLTDSGAGEDNPRISASWSKSFDL